MFPRLQQLAPGLSALRHYDIGNLRFDVVAGLSVAAVALPVGIAYSDIAKVPAVIGIYSAIFPLFAYALFGSSRQLITGPDAATCIMAAAAVNATVGGNPDRYAPVMVAMTLMVGVFYIGAGLLRLGFIASFLSHPILVGYINGIALLVIVGQLPKLLGIAPGGDGFFPQLAHILRHAHSTHLPTVTLGVCLLVVIIVLRHMAPRIPAPLVAAAAGITAVTMLDLDSQGVAVLGAVPAGFPTLARPSITASEFGPLVRDAAALMLISFTSGVLTSKTFAKRNGYDVDPNQELIGFGACNLASGLVQGFPVTGADSRTAVNNATGGKTQVVGIVAGASMLVFVLFFTGPLALLPTTALSAIILVSAFGLFDVAAVGTLHRVSLRELAFSLITTAGVLVAGVLHGVLLAVVLSLLWLLWLGSRPQDAILGRAPGLAGLHDIARHPDSVTIPGLLLYRFNANLVFFNCDYFRERVRKHISEATTPVKWVVIDASPVNVIDFTALQTIGELRQELQARGIVLCHAHAKQALRLYFRPDAGKDGQKRGGEEFETLEEAIAAFERQG